jgi:hypothetical protein
MVLRHGDESSDSLTSLNNNPQRALCFLTRQPNPNLIEFAQNIHQHVSALHGNVFIIIDDDTYDDKTIPFNGIHFVHVNKDECIEHGFRNSNLVYTNEFLIPSDQEPLKTLVIAWDKALYYFCRLNTQFEFVWFVEDGEIV